MKANECEDLIIMKNFKIGDKFHEISDPWWNGR